MLIVKCPCFIYLTMPDDIEKLKLTNDENGMTELTDSNIKNASHYISFILKKTAKNYFDSLMKKYTFVSFSFDEIYTLIKKISTDNSTRTSNENIAVIAKYVYNNKKDFLKRLKGGDYSLVDDIAKLSSRKEKSLASKICRFLEEWLFSYDNFTIIDTVITDMLPYYLIKHGVAFSGDLKHITYVDFMKLFNALKSKLRSLYPTITAHQIDAIIWGIYRKDSVRRTIAIALAENAKALGTLQTIGCICLPKVKNGILFDSSVTF